MAMDKRKLKVAVLSGGRSGEREVSLKSGAQVFRALNPERYEVHAYDPASDLPRLMAEAPNLDVALIIMHGRWGEDGTVQGLLELVGLPYVGSGVMSSAICMDKRATKDLYRRHGLPVARDLILHRGFLPGTDEIIARLGLPLVVKPACEGSSLGVAIVRTADRLEAGLADALARGDWVIVEEYIQGREITSSILGNDTLEALPLIEIIPDGRFEFFDYTAKYIKGATNEVCPAPLTPEETQAAWELGLAAHKALYCRGLSRTDMILKDGRYYLLETNTIPGLTETSLYPQAAQAAGYTFGQLMDRLIELAME